MECLLGGLTSGGNYMKFVHDDYGLDIIKQMSFQNPITTDLNREEMKSRIIQRYKNKKIWDNYKPVINSYKVALTNHAHNRGDERIGPEFELQRTHVNYILTSLAKLKRVVLLDREFGLIDFDILFTYKVREQTILITTIYGRCSDKPLLYNYSYLRSFNSIRREKIDLTGDKKDIIILPKSRIIIQYKDNHVIDRYETTEGDLFHAVIHYNQDGIDRSTNRFFTLETFADVYDQNDELFQMVSNM